MQKFQRVSLKRLKRKKRVAGKKQAEFQTKIPERRKRFLERRGFLKMKKEIAQKNTENKGAYIVRMKSILGIPDNFVISPEEMKKMVDNNVSFKQYQERGGIKIKF